MTRSVSDRNRAIRQEQRGERTTRVDWRVIVLLLLLVSGALLMFDGEESPSAQERNGNIVVVQTKDEPSLVTTVRQEPYAVAPDLHPSAAPLPYEPEIPRHTPGDGPVSDP